MPAVLIEQQGAIAILRLNRPEAMNAINEDIRSELPRALARLEADASVRAVVFTGAGYQVGLYCDLRVGYPELKIGQPEVKAGLGSILGSSQMMWHLPMGINAQLSLTGEFISGQRAYEVGLVNYLGPRAEVLAKAWEVATLLAGHPPTALRLTKERLREVTQAEFDDILVAAKKYQKRAYESGEPQRQMAAFLAARGKK